MEYSRHHHPLFKNPKAFISSLSQIDEDQIKDMIVMVKKLIDDGEKERQIAIDSEADGAADKDAKVKAHDDAIAATAAARDALGEGQKQLATYEGLEVESNKIQTADEAARDITVTDRDAKKDQMDEQNTRIDSESETFKEIEVLIKEISTKAEMEIKKGRNLLNVVDLKALIKADPDSIQDVLDLITELLQAGETERDGYVKEWNDAVVAYESAEGIYQESFKNWEISLGQIASQKTDNAALQKVVDDAKTDEDAKGESQNAARDELARRQAHLKEENERLDGEKQSCQEIINLLEDMVPDE